ncbi:hypothetical protein [Actinoplanes aureus]|uniref:Lipoprotein n=1 Tax=Actinoplanes aureus TaxID=2792083 RepID=A0A931C852_9ACTN|nr:hypothetical protein [Actinoplanes aureus]MBG0562701.1 hypothetical protein [Actinoplanes aureus]
MTTRRTLLLLAGSGLAAAATGCREPAAKATEAALPDVVLADSTRGLLRLFPGGEQRLGSAVVAFDGAHVYARQDADLVRFDPATGATTRSTALGGGWLPRAVSADGRACALGRTPAEVRPVARARTPLLITGPDGDREYDLPGVIEPDAFTTDGQGLFVLDWLPANAPETYRVRLLDLTTGELQPLLTRNKVPVPAGAEEEMRGEGRQAVLSADRQMLFTLYTHQPGHRHTRDLVSGRPGNAHAFVHVLHLTERWAYCLDLPHPFGEGGMDGHALAADQHRIAVVDLNSGKLAYAGPSSLTVEQVVDVRPAAGATAALILTTDGRTLIGGGDAVTVLDTAAHTPIARWELPAPIKGLALSRDGARLYAGAERRLIWLDATSGKRAGQREVIGLTAVKQVL